MANYRILEENGKFYPQWYDPYQEEWVFYLFTIAGKAVFNNLKSAKSYINTYISSPKIIIHEFNPQENGN